MQVFLVARLILQGIFLVKVIAKGNCYKMDDQKYAIPDE